MHNKKDDHHYYGLMMPLSEDVICHRFYLLIVAPRSRVSVSVLILCNTPIFYFRFWYDQWWHKILEYISPPYSLRSTPIFIWPFHNLYKLLKAADLIYRIKLIKSGAQHVLRCKVEIWIKSTKNILESFAAAGSSYLNFINYKIIRKHRIWLTLLFLSETSHQKIYENSIKFKWYEFTPEKYLSLTLYNLESLHSISQLITEWNGSL